MKGIILAGGHGTRLYPSTLSVSKQLMPVYDKPMIYYPLSNLMLAGIKEILLISTPCHIPLYKSAIGDGSSLGLKIEYKTQKEAKGLAEAFIIGEEFIGQDSVCLILGDNLFYGQDLTTRLRKATQLKKGGLIFGYRVDNPSRYGVLELGSENRIISVEEKPKIPKSQYAIPGIYFFDNNCIKFAKSTSPSSRGELEITSIMEQYIKDKSLRAELLGRGIAWLDTGTHDSLMEAATFVHVLEKRQGLKIACLEEIAYNMGFISIEQLQISAQKLKNSSYGEYLQKLVSQYQKNTLELKHELTV